MDVVSHMFRDGTIDKKTYVREAVEATLRIFQANGLQCRLLGMGTFADVIELKSKTSDAQLAAKIVAQKYTTSGETKLWQSLRHANILPLLSCQTMHFAHTTVFLMPIQPTSLDVMVRREEFREDSAGLERATRWLEGILQGVSYIHEQNMCHLDLKVNNILISLEDTALICDFGFLASAAVPIKRFVISFILI